jgi:hypothetical protein
MGYAMTVNLVVLPPEAAAAAAAASGADAPSSSGPSSSSCTAELVISSFEIRQSINGGPWTTSRDSAGQLVAQHSLPFYMTVGPDGRVGDVHFLASDDEEAVILKKGIASAFQVVVPTTTAAGEAEANSGGTDESGVRVTRRLQAASAPALAACSGDSSSTWSSRLLASPGAEQQWLADELDNTGIFRALYEVHPGACVSDVRTGALTPSVVLRKDRTHESYRMWADRRLQGEDKGSGNAAPLVHFAQTSDAVLSGHDGMLLSVSITAATGLTQGAAWMPPSGHPTSAVDNSFEAPPDRIHLGRGATATLSLLGVAPGAASGAAVDTESSSDSGASSSRRLSVRRLRDLAESTTESRTADAAGAAAGKLRLRDFEGKAVLAHGLPLLHAARSLRADEVESENVGGSSRVGVVARGSRSLLVASDLLPDFSPEYLTRLRSNIQMSSNAAGETAAAAATASHGSAAAAAEAAEGARTLLAETLTQSVEHGFDPETKSAYLEYTRTNNAGFAGAGETGSRSSAKGGKAAPPQARSPHDRLIAALACLPAEYFDDSIPSEPLNPSAGNEIMPCLQSISNATRLDSAVIISAHRLLLSNPCLNPYSAAAEALARPDILSRSAPRMRERAEETRAVWLADEDGTSCDNPSIVATRLSHRLVDVLVGLITSHLYPEAAHVEALLLTMLLRPDLYRYPTVLEFALQTLFLYDTPSEALAEASIHVAFNVEEEIDSVAGGEIMRVHMSDPWAVALLASAALLAKGRAFHAAAGTIANPSAGPADDLDLGAGDAFASNVASRHGLGITDNILSDKYAAHLRSIHAARAARGLASYDADRLDGVLLAYVNPLLARARTIHDKESGHYRLATEAAALMWPEIPEHQQSHYMGVAEGLPVREMNNLLSFEEEAGGYTSPEAMHVQIRGIAAFRDAILRDTAKDPSQLETTRYRAAQRAVMRAGKGMLGAWNTTRAEAVHQARRAAARDLTYDTAEISEAYHVTDTLLRVLSNLAHPEGLKTAFNFIDHHDLRLREAALHVLHRAGPAAFVPEEYAGRRLGVTTPDSPLTLLAEYGGDMTASGVAEAAAAAEADSSSSSIPAPFTLGRLLADHWSLFPHAVSGTEAVDVEEHLLEMVMGHHDLATATAAVHTLTALRPLRHATVDALLDYWEEEHMHFENPEQCVAACTATKPSCSVIPFSHCEAACDATCAARGKLQVAVAEFIHHRVELELEDPGAADDSWAGSAGSMTAAADSLHGAARRVSTVLESEEIVDFLQAGLSSDPAVAAAAAACTNATCARRLASGASHARRLAAIANARGRQLSYRSLDGRPLQRQLSRARRLGIFTLLDLQVGKGLYYNKLFGEDTLGCRVRFENRNLFKIRITLFDGFFRMEEVNAFGLFAQLWVLRINIVDAKAALVGGYAYINKIARDVADVIARVADATIGNIQKIAGKIVVVITAIIEDSEMIIDGLQTYMDSLDSFLNVSRGLSEGAVASAEMADAFLQTFDSGRLLPAAQRASSEVAGTSLRFVHTLRGVDRAATTLDWRATLGPQSAVAADNIVTLSAKTHLDLLEILLEGVDSSEALNPKGIAPALAVLSTLSGQALAAEASVTSALELIRGPVVGQALAATGLLLDAEMALQAVTGAGRSGTLSSGANVTFNTVQYAELVSRTVDISFSPINAVVEDSGISGFARNFITSIEDPVFRKAATLGGEATSRLPSTIAPLVVLPTVNIGISHSGRRRMQEEDSNVVSDSAAENGLADIVPIDPAVAVGEQAAVAASQVATAFRTLHAAACKVRPLVHAAVVKGVPGITIGTDVGGSILVTRPPPASLVLSTLTTAADSFDAVNSLASDVFFGPGGLEEAFSSVINSLAPTMETLTYRGAFLRDALDLVANNSRRVRHWLDFSSNVTRDFAAVEGAYIGGNATGVYPSLTRRESIFDSFPAGVETAAAMTLASYSSVYAPLAEAIDQVRLYSEGIDRLRADTADWVSRNNTPGRGYYAGYQTAIGRLRVFNESHHQYLSGGDQRRRLELLLTVTGWMADLPIPVLSDMAKAVKITNALLVDMDKLTDTMVSWFEFEPKIALLDRAVMNIRDAVFAANSRDNYTEAFRAVLADVGVNAARVDGDEFLASFTDHVEAAFGSARQISADAPGIAAVVRNAAVASAPFLDELDDQIATLLAAINVLDDEVRPILKGFKDAAYRIEDARSYFAQWDVAATAASPPWREAWGASVDTVQSLIDLNQDITDIVSLGKLMAGGIDSTTCEALSATVSLEAAYEGAGSATGAGRRRLLRSLAEDGSTVIEAIFEKDDDIGLGATGVRIAPAAAAASSAAAEGSASRSLQSGGDFTVPSQLTAEETARLFELGILTEDDRLLGLGFFDPTFCFLPFDLVPPSRICELVVPRITEAATRLGLVDSIISSARLKAASASLARAVVDAPPVLADAISAANATISTFDTSAVAFLDIMARPNVRYAITNSSSTSTAVRSTLSVVGARVSGAVLAPLTRLDARIVALLSSATMYRDGVPRVTRLVESLPDSISLLNYLIAVTPELPPVVASSKFIIPELGKSTRNIAPLTVDPFTYSLEAAQEALRAFYGALRSGRRALVMARRLPRLLRQVRDFIEKWLNLGVSEAELGPWDEVPWCKGEEFCMRVITRSSTIYRKGVYQLRYLNVSYAPAKEEVRLPPPPII